MRVIEHIEELRAAIGEYRNRPATRRQSVGFVPTMGYLHAGHESLLRKARAEDDAVVLSIFVNPLQFGPNEDFDRYPRDAERDLRIAEIAGVDIVFMPSVSEIYPEYPLASKITVGETASRLCGASRPGHFDGVATVVLKLLNIVMPDRAYFGMKDAQQVAVIKQVVRDFNVPVDIVPCPTVREEDGLAMSSRNVYLSDEERRQAVILFRALEEAGRCLETGRCSAAELEARIKGIITEAPLAKIDYASVLAYPSLTPLAENVPLQEALSRTNAAQLVVALAIKFGRTRLIDNRIFSITEVYSHV